MVQCGFSHFSVLYLPFKKGKVVFFNDFGLKVLPFLLSTLQFAFCGISAVLCLLVELELSPLHESFLHL